MASLTCVNTMTDLMVYGSPRLAPVEPSLMVLGYYAVGDGGGGLFYWDGTSTEEDNQGTIIRPRWVTGESGRWKRHVNDYVSVKWFGAKGNDSHDPADMARELAAFENAIRSLSPLSLPTTGAAFPTPPSGWQLRGPTVMVPPGTYRLNATLRIDRPVVLRGAGGAGWYSSSVLQFHSAVDGIEFYRYTPSPGPADPAQAAWAVIQDLAIKGAGATTRGHGVVMKAIATVEHCYITKFGGDGIHIEASAPTTGANKWSVQNVRIDFCDNGLYVNGPDCNAGICSGLDASDNRRWGVYDSSFLGNTYVGCHTANNSLGSYKTDDPNQRSLFLNCYTEGGQQAEIIAPSIILGGFMPNFGDAGQMDMSTAHATFPNGVVGRNALGSTLDKLAVFGQLGGRDVGGSAFEFGANFDGLRWRLMYQRGYVGWWELNWGNLGVGTALSFCNNAAPEYTQKQAEGRPKLWFQNGYFLGHYDPNPANDQRVFTLSGNAAPTAGAWKQGDRMLNSQPKPNGYAGWICVEAGTPGIWKGFGRIDP